METTKTDNELIAEFMGFPKVTVGSSWDYNRQFDHALITKNLIVKEVDDIKNAEFEQKMPFTKYGLDAFDGIIFRPSGYPEYSLSKFHCPARPYHTSWDWLMPVVEKIWKLDIDTLNLGADFTESQPKENIFRLPLMVPIDMAYTSVVEFIKFYNQEKNQQSS